MKKEIIKQIDEGIESIKYWSKGKEDNSCILLEMNTIKTILASLKFVKDIAELKPRGMGLILSKNIIDLQDKLKELIEE